MDIENKSELYQYLKVQGLIPNESSLVSKVLNGGVSSKTIWVETPKGPLVVKQSLSKLKTKADWYSNPDRLRIESDGLKWMHEKLPAGNVPQHAFFDHKHFILGMEGIQEPNLNYKEILLEGKLTTHLVEETGNLLGSIHRLGFQDQKAAEIFKDKSYFVNLRMEPYYEYSSMRLPETSSFFESLIEDTLKVTVTIVHGDFSPKNVLVKDDHLILLDFEVMHFGDPAFDVGFLLCHFLSKANYHQNVAYVDAAKILWKHYCLQFRYNEEGFEVRCVRHLLGCLIARIHGRSPLEYLTPRQQDWQSETALKGIRKPWKMEVFLENYKSEMR